MKVSERIRSNVEKSVRDGTLLPGDPIDEAKLVAEYGVSKTPVREALLQLQAQGLLASLPRGGMAVAKMDIQQLLSMWELLADLESLCARYACVRFTAAEREQLSKLHAAAAPVVERDDVRGWQAANLEFHEALYQGARNPYLRQEILRMRARTGAYRMHAFGAVGQLQASYAQHAEVVQAICAGDSASAARAMFEHMSPGHGTRGVTDVIINLPKDLLN